METKRKSAKVVVSLLALAGLAVFSLFAVGGSLEPSAPPGPTMKTLDEVEPRIPIHASDLPLTITEPNSYYLVEDISFASTANHAITIECNDVTIDLMGYTLKGPDSGTKSGIYMSGRSNVEIRNGTVRDFGHTGVYGPISWSKENRVINVRALSNGNNGIDLSGSGHVIKDCTAAHNGIDGIRALNGCTVTGNICYDNSDDGIYTLLGSTVTSNTCYDNGGNGMYAGDGSTVISNTCRENVVRGLVVGSGSTVTGNTVYQNGSHGIDAGTGCTIIGNTAKLNTGNGIDSSGLGTIADNSVDRNSGYGISVTSGAVVARNSCAENTLDGIKAGDGNRIVGNDCVGNGFGGDGAGIHVTSQRNVIMDNTALQNDRGIDVDTANNLIVKNSASTNSTEYSIAGGNKVGTISTDPTTAGPWDNFDF